MNNGYERFGKYLLAHLGIIENPDDMDWDYIVSEYNKLSIKTKPGLMYINWLVATHFDQDPYEVRTNKMRKPDLITPKHTVMYLATTLYNYTQYDLRDFYGLNERSTISSALRKIEGWLTSDKYFKAEFEQITNKLLGYEQLYKRPFPDTIGGGESFYKTAVEEGNSVSVHRDGEIKSSD